MASEPQKTLRVRTVYQTLQERPVTGWPTSCPLCHESGVQFVFEAASTTTSIGEGGADSDRVELPVQCPNVKCGRLYIAQFIFGRFVGATPTKPRPPEVPAEVRDISPVAVTCYEQAIAAEALELKEIAGGGYRKALEFLVKDYCKSEHPGEHERIELMSLGPCITEFVDDAKLKLCASRAAWLGNDQLHYVQKWEGQDLDALKNLLRLAIYWVASQLQTRAILEEMPEPR